MIVRWPRFSFYGVLVLALVADQLTKAWATRSLQPVRYVELIPGFFDLTYVRNPGIAFGMFAHQGWLVAIFMIVLVAVAFYFMRGMSWAGWEPNVVGGALCGGAVGNLVDRWRYGYVVDFFDAHVAALHLYWPVFNVADSLICMAVGWIVIRQLKS